MIFRLVVSFVFALFFSVVFVSAHAADACRVSADCSLGESHREPGMNGLRENFRGDEMLDQVILRATWIDAAGVEQNLYQAKQTRSTALDHESRRNMIEERQVLLAACMDQIKVYEAMPACPKKGKHQK